MNQSETGKYALQKVEIRNNIPLDDAQKEYKKITKKKPRIVRHSTNFYQFRYLPPTKFEPRSFRTKVVNDDIRLVYGKLKQDHQHLEGRGLFDYFTKTYDYIKNKVSDAFSYIKDAVSINDFSDKTKKNLDLYGEYPIIALQIRRVPIAFALDLALQGVSAGEWERLKEKYGFDKFFHLSMVATLKGAKEIVFRTGRKVRQNKQLAIEKLEVVSVNENIEITEGMETQDVVIPKGKVFSIKDMFQKARDKVGDTKFFSYSALGQNNCQDFIALLLDVEGLYNEPERNFVYQDISQLIKELPDTTKAIAQGITHIGALANKYLGIGGSRVSLDDIYRDHIVGNGKTDIVIPKKEFVKEHKHLVKLLSSSNDPKLKKEAKDQAEELAIKGKGISSSKQKSWLAIEPDEPIIPILPKERSEILDQELALWNRLEQLKAIQNPTEQERSDLIDVELELEKIDKNRKKRGGNKSSTHRENILKRYKLKDKSYNLEELSKISSVPLDILQEVYNRGVGAYKTNPKSVRLKGSYVKNVDAPLNKKLSKEQWGYARVYSFLDGNPEHDNDLRKNKIGSGEYETDSDTETSDSDSDSDCDDDELVGGQIPNYAILTISFTKKPKKFQRITIHTKTEAQMKTYITKLKQIAKKLKINIDTSNLKYAYIAHPKDLLGGMDWYEMPEYAVNPEFFKCPYIQLQIEKTKKAEPLLTALNFTPETLYEWFPSRPKEFSEQAGKVWITSDKITPKYPIYIISVGRWEKRLTSRYLEKAGIDYKIVVEPAQAEEYKKVIDPKKVLVLPKNYSKKNLGGIPARNFVWEHSKKAGYARHWILDDNIDGYSRFNKGERIKVFSGVAFRCIEDYVDRYTNIKMAGHNYYMFASSKALKPIIKNTRIYSSILLSNDTDFKWRGRYNEDTDLSLRILKAGYATALFNNMLANKVATMSQKGGNTDTIYGVKNAHYLKAESLVKQHPDVAIIKERFHRIHHYVDYSGFKDNHFEFKKGVEAKLKHRNNNYTMKLVDKDKFLGDQEEKGLTQDDAIEQFYEYMKAQKKDCDISECFQKWKEEHDIKIK